MKILLIFQKQCSHTEQELFLNESIRAFLRNDFQVQVHEIQGASSLPKFLKRLKKERFDSIHFVCFKKRHFWHKLILELYKVRYTSSFSCNKDKNLPLTIEFNAPENTSYKVGDFQYPIYASKAVFDKNQGIEAFCNLDLKGTMILFGSGPLKKEYEEKFGHKVLFFPVDQFKKMSHLINVFIYTRKKSVVAMYVLEALSYSIPIASVVNPAAEKIIRKRMNGFVSNDLQLAALECLSISRMDCLQSVKSYFMSDRFKVLARNCLG